MFALKTLVAQSFPSKPAFTAEELQDQTGKVFVVTGGYSGVGYELSKILYEKHAVVYIAGRRVERADKAIGEMKTAHPDSKGRLEYLQLDLGDLASIKTSANAFLEKEQRLDVLWNNAGVMGGRQDAPDTKQGHEMHLGTNCLGPFLFTKLLHPLLVSTAKSSPEAAVRVIWLGSIMIDLYGPSGGLEVDNLDYKKKSADFTAKYTVSKVGNRFIGAEWARRDAETGVIHLTINPGNLKTSLQATLGKLERKLLDMTLYAPIYGAYTELFAGLSPTIKKEDSGRYVIPWGGSFGQNRSDVEAELGGHEGARSGLFFDYCEKATKEYV